MFKIGLFKKYNKKEGSTKPIFTDKFEEKCKVYHLDREDVTNQLSELDGLIMHYDEAIEKSYLYEQIVIIRNISAIPIWIVSEKMAAIERLTFLKLNTFVVVKKFNLDEELCLTVTNLLKVLNQRQHLSQVGKPQGKNEIEINEKNSSIHFKEGQIIQLTKLEHQLFTALAKESNKVLLYTELISLIWGATGTKNEICRLSNLVFHVREKLKQGQVNPNLIKTVRSKGYMLAE